MLNNKEQDFILLKCNLKRFIENCEKAKTQKTTKGLTLKTISGTFKGFKLYPSFGSGNLIKKPGLAFLKDDNAVSKGIYPIIVFIPDSNEIITCKCVSYDNTSNMKWERFTNKDIPMSETNYSDEKGKWSYLRNSYSLSDLGNAEIILNIQKDIYSIIDDYPKKI